MIVKTDAIVLKTMKYRETSKIVTLLTKKYGRLSVVVKGGRDRNGTNGRALDMMNHVHVVLYKNEGRDLHLLTQCDPLSNFVELTRDLGRLGCAMAVLELVHKAVHSEEENIILYERVLNTLQALNEAQQNFTSILLCFELQLLDTLGFRPDLDVCVTCRRSTNDVHGTNNQIFRLRPGGMQCEICGKGETATLQIRRETLQHLRKLQSVTDNGKAAEIVPPEPVHHEATRAVWYYFRSHVDGIRRLRSEELFSAVA